MSLGLVRVTLAYDPFRTIEKGSLFSSVKSTTPLFEETEPCVTITPLKPVIFVILVGKKVEKDSIYQPVPTKRIINSIT
ncbi:hypothetical protein M1316_02350 [Candidatus Parvarchaeota archaeon]|nr:hypothetical protein [Candidatus Parvarchaeota archaeon]